MSPLPAHARRATALTAPALALALALLPACQSPGSVTAASAAPGAPAATAAGQATAAGDGAQMAVPFTASMPARLAALMPGLDARPAQPAPALLLGEQHDAAEHQRLHRATVEALAARGLLAAVVIEMAERGRSTQDLPPGASEAQVQAALDWEASGWPWDAYGPVLMAAVRAGVTVRGGNLPRREMRAAMAETALDATLDAQGLQAQRQNIRDGHCGLLPESQIPAMARVQLARDRAMAQALADAWRPGRTVLLVAGAEHVRRDLGVPQQMAALALPWPDGVTAARVVVMRAGSAGRSGADRNAGDAPALADAIWETPPVPAHDHCAELREQWKAGAPAR